jgi:hypothetical protein
MLVRNFLILAIAVSMPCAAVWASELPCTLTKADYTSLANTQSKATPESVKKMSADDQEDLCETRAYINLIQKKKGDIDLDDVANHPYLARFLTTEEKDAVKRAASKALAGPGKSILEKCQKIAQQGGDAGRACPK